MKNLILPFVVVALFAVGSCGDEPVQPSSEAVEISSFTPDSVITNHFTYVVISGKNFSSVKDSNKVWFAQNMQAKIDSATPTQLFLRTPYPIITGSIVVSNGKTFDTSSANFRVVENPFRPIIIDFNPKSGDPGTYVKIKGKNFEKGMSISFNGAYVPSYSVYDGGTEITLNVPDGAKTGPISVQAQNVGGSMSKEPFTVPIRQTVFLNMALQIIVKGFYEDPGGKISPASEGIISDLSDFKLQRYGDTLLTGSSKSNLSSETFTVNIQLDPVITTIKQLYYSKSYYSESGSNGGAARSSTSYRFMLKDIPYSMQDSTIEISLDSAEVRTLFAYAGYSHSSQALGGGYRQRKECDTIVSNSAFFMKLKYK